MWKIIECLKKSGLEIKEIKYYFELCELGTESFQKRYELFEKQKKTVEAEIKHLNEVLDTINYKLWYYSEAIKDGNEDNLKNKKEFIDFHKKN